MAYTSAGVEPHGFVARLFRAFLSLVSVFFTLCSLVGAVFRVLPEELQRLPYVPEVAALAPEFVIVAVLGLLCALASRRWFTALLALLCSCTLAWYQYPFFVPSATFPSAAQQAVSERVPDTRDGYVRVMTANVYMGQADPQAIVNMVRDERVEVLALQETSKRFIGGLERAGIDDYLPYSQVSSSDGRFGNGLWSATPLDSPSNDDVHSRSSFMPGGTLSFPGGKGDVRFVSVHTTSPQPGSWAQWSQTLDDLCAKRADTSKRYVFLGDFNASYDHTAFRNFLGDRFTDAARESGHGLVFTWPDDIRGVPRFVGIDHVILDRGMSAGQVRSEPVPGSDHAALLATIAV